MIVRFSSSLFLPYIVIELIAIYFYIDSYGFFSFLAEVILSAVFGMFIVFNIGFKNLKDRFNALKPTDIFSSFGIGLGGFLLFLPGIISDCFGIIIACVSILVRKNSNDDISREFKRYDDEVIDVEVVDDSRNIR